MFKYDFIADLTKIGNRSVHELLHNSFVYNLRIYGAAAETTAAWIVGNWSEHLSEVFCCSTMHAPVSYDTVFEVDPLFNRKPMKVISERRRYVVEHS